MAGLPAPAAPPAPPPWPTQARTAQAAPQPTAPPHPAPPEPPLHGPDPAGQTASACLLLADREGPARQQLAARLRAAGHRVTVTDDPRAIGRAAQEGAEVVLMNPALGAWATQENDGVGDADPWWQLRQLRQQVADLPVLVLQVGSDGIDRIVALELGADAVLDPTALSERELLAHVRALLRLRRVRSVPRPGAWLARWALDGLKRQAHVPGRGWVPLSHAEYRLLHGLWQRPGQTLSRQQLLDLARGEGVDQHDRSIDALVCRLRRRLRSPQGEEAIHTVRGSGYRFNPEPAAASVVCQAPNTIVTRA